MDKKFVYFVHGTNFNEDSEYADFTVGYNSTEKKATEAAEKYIADNMTVEDGEFKWYPVKKAEKKQYPFVVKKYADGDDEEGIAIFVEAFPLDEILK